MIFLKLKISENQKIKTKKTQKISEFFFVNNLLRF